MFHISLESSLNHIRE
jgi:Dynein heavy chain, N-terminal region 1